MPTILRIGSLRFFFFSHEGVEPPHIHVAAGEKEAKFWLSPISLSYSYGFKAHEQNNLINIVHDHQTEFLEAWNEFFSNPA